jgi:hypothetical protein
MRFPNYRFVDGIITAPSQGAITGFVVKEPSVAKASMVFVRLLEFISVTAFRASDDEVFCWFISHTRVGRIFSLKALQVVFLPPHFSHRGGSIGRPRPPDKRQNGALGQRCGGA